MSIQYQIVSGSLPPSMSFVEGRLIGSLAGTRAPIWLTEAGRIGSFNQGATVALSIIAAPSAGANTLAYSLVDAGRTGNFALPTGLILSATSGAISGVAGGALNPLAQDFTESEVPLWTTPTALGTYNEQTVFPTTTLVATPRNGTLVVAYEVLSEVTEVGLPPGLQLNVQTGVLSGSISQISDDVPPTLTPVPLWQIDSGLLAVVEVGGTASIQLAATPQLGSIITSWMIIDENAGLPAGLNLNIQTGQISGTLDVGVSEVPFVPPPIPPIFVTPPNLGTFARGQAVGTIAISANVAPDRTLNAYVVQSDTFLPHGLQLGSGTGQITGTISTIQAAQATTFAVVVIDSTGASAQRNFVITTS